MKKTYRSLFLELNMKQRSEHVAADTIYSDTPAMDDSSAREKVFAGTKTLVTNVYGAKSDKQFC